MLTLRPLAESDRHEFVRVLTLSEPLHGPWSPRRPLDDTWEDFFERQLGRHQAATDWKGVGVLPDGRIGGFFNLNEIVRGPFQNAYAGWSVNAEVAGQGVATEGVRLLLKRAFALDGIGLHRVQANIVPRNVRSIRVAQKVGFRFEGLALRYLSIDGGWQDHAMYAITAEEL